MGNPDGCHFADVELGSSQPDTFMYLGGGGVCH